MASPVTERKRMETRGGESGFTLLEMMIALFILTVSILGLTALTITSMQTNQQNDLRNTAIKLTSEVAEILLTQPIANIVSGGLQPYDATNTALIDSTNTAINPSFRKYPNPVQKIKNGTQLYTVNWTVTTLTDNLKQIIIQVQYTYKGNSYVNNATIYKHSAI